MALAKMQRDHFSVKCVLSVSGFFFNRFMSVVRIVLWLLRDIEFFQLESKFRFVSVSHWQEIIVGDGNIDRLIDYSFNGAWSCVQTWRARGRMSFFGTWERESFYVAKLKKLVLFWVEFFYLFGDGKHTPPLTPSLIVCCFNSRFLQRSHRGWNTCFSVFWCLFCVLFVIRTNFMVVLEHISFLNWLC